MSGLNPILSLSPIIYMKIIERGPAWPTFILVTQDTDLTGSGLT